MLVSQLLARCMRETVAGYFYCNVLADLQDIFCFNYILVFLSVSAPFNTTHTYVFITYSVNPLLF